MNLVHIGDLTFDADGYTTPEWVAELLAGWHSSPPMRVTVEDRPNQDGAFGSVKNYRGARVLNFIGALRGEDQATVETELFDAFAAIQSDGVPFPISVENDQGTRTVTATLQGSAEVTPHPDFCGARVGATFVCYDPVKYGSSADYVTGLAAGGGGLEYELYEGGSGGALYYGALGDLGRVEVTNAGTADSWPFFTVTGDLTEGFTVTCLETSEQIRYDRVVPAGGFVTIDSRTGEVLVDGESDASTYLTRDEFFAVPKMATRTIQFDAISGSSGSPELTVTFASGWW